MKILEPITASLDEMVAIRRDIHAHPETAYEEQRTAELIANKLTSWDIPIHRGLGITGVVGTITGNHPGAAIGLRADIDALPMPEQNTFAHASKNPGKMHACGHDGHTTMLLAALSTWLRIVIFRAQSMSSFSRQKKALPGPKP